MKKFKPLKSIKCSRCDGEIQKGDRFYKVEINEFIYPETDILESKDIDWRICDKCYHLFFGGLPRD